MNLLQLKYFYEVAKSGSVTESARTLRISQPAVSKMLRLLEQDLEQTLLVRTRAGVKLTGPGEILFESASRIFAEVTRGKEAMKSAGGELLGDWALGASDNIAVYFVPRVLGRFKEKHPRLRVGLFAGTSSQIKTELTLDRCRLGIFYTPLKASEPFESRLLMNTEFWIVLARKNRWFKKEKPRLEDLTRANVPRIESRHSDYSGGFPAHFHSRKLGLTSQPWLEVNQHEIKKRLVEEGFGFALLTRHTVEEDVRDGKLIRVCAPKGLPAPIYAAWKKGQSLDRASEAFLSDFLAEHEK